MGALPKQLDRGRLGQRLERVLALGRDPQHLAARAEHLEARAAREQLRELAGRIDDLLEVVEHDQHLAVADVLVRARPAARASRRSRAATSAGSRTALRSTNHVPSAKASVTSEATAIEKRVFPVPPGPLSVTTRARSTASSRMTSTSSFLRPTSGFAGVGRFVW